MSPELFLNKPYNSKVKSFPLVKFLKNLFSLINLKSDVWALGCCVYEMATLKHAFNAKDINALFFKILK